ncbi:diguanylate cyclase domain protein [Xanthomonas translucens pv. poae]|uniref:diguanylate cyclase n=1 Tax=Xanthomonas graminis pv. poae TaxID=227946 RepID=A0A0K3A1H0_9XANT|nr:ligand-binding sensor domain-containing diguanylate cyclase [Xanthomonas translucens]CTP91092.1 diguanylate cyclase domain protein [Xanthomonas translucens pv. poae]
MPNSHPSPSPSLSRGIAWRLAAVLALCACIGAVAAQEYSFRNYAQADGLQGLSINCLYADRHGVVWACTELGLHRYERERFEQIGADTGFGSPLVHAIAEDRRQRMWVGTSNALYVGDGRRFAAVPAADGRRLRVDQGQSLAAFGDDIVVLSDKRPLRISAGATGGWQVAALRTADAAPLAEVYSVTAIGEALWLGCGRALCRLDAQGRLQRLGRADGVPDDIWLALLRDRNGTLWARSIHHILACPAGAAGFSERAPPPGSALSTMAVGINLVEDAAGRVLTRSDTGLLRWEGGQWRAFERAQGLEALAPNIAPLLSDRQGRLWMGTRGRGVQRWLGYGLIQHWEEPQGLATAPTWSILRSRGDGRLYVGSEMGANVLDPVSGRMLPLTDVDGQVLRQTVQLVDAADGTLWLGQSSGRVLRLDRSSGRMREQAKVLPALKWMFFDDAGTLWILTTRGLFLLPAGEPSAQPARDLPRDQFVGGGYDARHRLWLVGQNGLYLRQAQGWQSIRLRGTGLPDAELDKFSISASDEVWLSFGDVGVWRGQFEPRSASVSLRKVDDPLLARILPYVLHQDRQQRLWIGSSQGLDLWSGGRWIRVTQADGLLWDDTSESAFFQDADGTVWIGNSKGVSQILDPTRLFAVRPLQLQLLRATRAGKAVTAGAQLPWSQKPIEFAFSAPGAVGGSDTIGFRYRLEGLQEQWAITPQAHLSYTLLSPGHYALEVQALDERQRTRSNVVRLEFTILPPWWRSPLAWIAYALAAALLLAAVWHWRVKQLLSRERTLARLVAERTRELEHDKRELERARAALALKAVRDDLTGLLNRVGILDALAVQMQRSRKDGSALAVAMIDLDHFKQINDRHGHLIGDAVLARVGRRMNANLRGADLIGRYGGEELLAVLPGLLPPAHTRLYALHEVIGATPFLTDAGLLEITASIGVAWHRPGETLQQLLSRADEALYRAKHGGRNRVELHLDPQPGHAVPR